MYPWRTMQPPAAQRDHPALKRKSLPQIEFHSILTLLLQWKHRIKTSALSSYSGIRVSGLFFLSLFLSYLIGILSFQVTLYKPSFTSYYRTKIIRYFYIQHYKEFCDPFQKALWGCWNDTWWMPKNGLGEYLNNTLA